jgi:hypothetical protein
MREVQQPGFFIEEVLQRVRIVAAITISRSTIKTNH